MPVPSIRGVKSALVPVLSVWYAAFLYLLPMVVVVPAASTAITPITSAFHMLFIARVFGPLTFAVICASTEPELFGASFSFAHATSVVAVAARMKSFVFIFIKYVFQWLSPINQNTNYPSFNFHEKRQRLSLCGLNRKHPYRNRREAGGGHGCNRHPVCADSSAQSRCAAR